MNSISPAKPAARKPKILVFNKYYLPGYRAGGPIRTIANMVDRLGDTLDFWVVTGDRDSGDVVPYPNIDLHDWNAQGGARVRYMAASNASLRTIQSIIEEVAPDYIYLNSFFDPFFTQRVLWLKRLGRIGRIPIVLAPRGEFSIGALQLKSLKKRAYMMISRLAGLYEKITWQASSAHEKADILKAIPFIPPASIKVAMNLAPAHKNDPDISLRGCGGPLRLCFLSRISAMKNLDFALSCLKSVKEEVDFAIYGPKRDASYWAECEAIIASLPKNISVTYMGEVEHRRVAEVLRGYDLFFLPTRGENYGHVIQEALSAGLPVLISDQTPWRDLEENGVGWVLPLESTAAFSKRIDEYASVGSAAREAASRRSREYALSKVGDSSVLQANLDLFCSASTGEQR